MSKIIYTPSGRAGEYANHGYAANLYSGCPHGCAYCFNVCYPWVTDAEKFHSRAVPKANVLRNLERELARLGKFVEPLFLCFACDPYPPVEKGYGITRRTIEMVHDSGNHIRILRRTAHLQKGTSIY